ncbi:cytochrome P450 [Rhypophila sp. PSN 637]
MAYNAETFLSYSQTFISNLTIDNTGRLFLIGFITWYIITSITSYLPLRHIPGPPLLVHSVLYQAIRASQAKLPADLYLAIQKYGHIVRVGPNHIVTDEPEMLRRSWGVRSEYTRSRWYLSMRLLPERDNVVSMTDEQAHNTMRAKLGPGYSGREVDDFEERVDRNVLCPGQIDWREICTRRQGYGSVEKDTRDEDLWKYIKTLEDNFPAMMVFSAFPWVVDVMRWKIFRALMPGEKDLFGLGRVIAVSNEVVAKRFGSDKETVRDMLGSFIKNGLTQEEAESETTLQIVAGSDTSAGSIRTALYHLMTHPQAMERLRQEIDSRHLSWPIAKDAETREMPHLHAVIRENQRVLPPVGGLFPKVSPPGGDTLNGVYIPPGTEVGVSWTGMMRRRDLWGANPEEFDPERFLDGAATPEVLRERTAVVEMVFGHGRFKCLGRTVAFLAVTKVIVEEAIVTDDAVGDAVKVNATFFGEMPSGSNCESYLLQPDTWLERRLYACSAILALLSGHDTIPLLPGLRPEDPTLNASQFSETSSSFVL